MGAVKMNIRTKGPRPIGANRPRKFKSPIDKAKGYEVAWQQVSPLFEAARNIESCCFVYFIGEPDDGPLKIGTSKDPIARLRGMQTGNPRRLRVEYVLVGSPYIEKLLHEMWEDYAIFSARTAGRLEAAPGTEWFKAEIREKLMPIVATAVDFQLDYLGTTEGARAEKEFERCIREAHGEHDFEVKGRDVLRFLAAGGGYAIQGRSSRV